MEGSSGGWIHSIDQDGAAPDLIEELLGWKVLAVGEEGALSHHLDQMHSIVLPTALSSPVRHTPWPTGDWLRASCPRHSDHRPPEEGCTCGIYALTDARQAHTYLHEAPLSVLTRVGLAGKVIPGERGWRAERARIVALTRAGIGLREYPALFGRVARRYDVPIIDIEFPVHRAVGRSED